MTPTDPEQRSTGSRPGDFRRKAIWAGVAVAAALLAWVFGAYVVPRWWAQRLGDFVDGRLTVGSITGIVLGAVFIFLPLLILWAGIRFRRTWKRALVFVLAALLLASPVLVIGTIVWGNGNAAHAGERILDVEGPGVRGGAFLGVLIGVVAFVTIASLNVSRGVNKRKAQRYRDELRDRDQTVEQPPSS